MTTMNEGQDTVTLSPLFGEGGSVTVRCPVENLGNGKALFAGADYHCRSIGRRCGR